MDDLHEKFSSKFVETLKQSVDKRMSTYEKQKILLVASALESRFKLQWCNQSESTEILSFLLSILEVMMSQSDDPTKEDKQPPKKRQRGFFGAIITASSDSTEQGKSDHQLEINDYLSTPCLPGDANPLAFWQNHNSSTLIYVNLFRDTWLSLPRQHQLSVCSASLKKSSDQTKKTA